ncbi:hypothetical protein BGZ95_007998, partial [Linnemannia exigua]
HPIPHEYFAKLEERWQKQEQQNAYLTDLVTQLTQQLQHTIAQQNGPPAPVPVAPSSSAFPLQSMLPPQHPAYGRYDDPNRPAPEFPSRIESFSGNQLTIDLDEYLSDIELHFTNKNCPETKKVSSFCGLLKSGARQWAEQYLGKVPVDQVSHWPSFKAAFRARWRVTHLTTNLRAEIENLRRLQDETLASFAARYLALANRIPDRSDKDKKLDFARKMPPWFQSRISDLHNEEDALDSFLHKIVAKDAAIKTFERQDGHKNGNGQYRRGYAGNRNFGASYSPIPIPTATKDENAMDLDNISAEDLEIAAMETRDHLQGI